MGFGRKVLISHFSVASLAPNSTLLGSSPKDAALIDQWISVADNEIGNYDRIVNQLTRGLIPYSKSVSKSDPTRLYSLS